MSATVQGDGLTGSEPACHEDARRLLHGKGHYTRRIIRVCPDSIIYLNTAGRVMTAWLQTSEDGKTRKITPERGMPAWPGA